jgi:hypothetical protein
MSSTRPLRATLFLPVALLLGAATLSAQTTVEETRKMADEIHARAMSVAGETIQLHELPAVVTLHGESAYLRDWQDPKAYECWTLQANLLAHVGEYEAAAAFLDAAANLALSQGQPGLAAQAWLDAAFVMRSADQDVQARTLARKAWDLRGSAELSALEQEEIDRRVIVR